MSHNCHIDKFWLHKGGWKRLQYSELFVIFTRHSSSDFTLHRSDQTKWDTPLDPCLLDYLMHWKNTYPLYDGIKLKCTRPKSRNLSCELTGSWTHVRKIYIWPRSPLKNCAIKKMGCTFKEILLFKKIELLSVKNPSSYPRSIINRINKKMRHNFLFFCAVNK